MNIDYLELYSGDLDRQMPMSVYGHGGRPVLFIPCQDGHHYDFANFHMDEVFRWWIESGKCTVFAIDTIDEETWSNSSAAPYDRIRLHRLPQLRKPLPVRRSHSRAHGKNSHAVRLLKHTSRSNLAIFVDFIVAFSENLWYDFIR